MTERRVSRTATTVSSYVLLAATAALEEAEDNYEDQAVVAAVAARDWDS